MSIHRAIPKAVLVVSACVLFSFDAAAQTAPNPSPPTKAPQASEQPAQATPAEGAPAVQPSAGAIEEAQKRYSRGMELFNEGTFDAALLEFRRAYTLAPTFRILYNIGLVNVQMNDYVGALDSFEKYLADGGDQISQARRDDVRTRMANLQEKVAFITVKCNINGAEVTVDDVVVGKIPLSAAIRVNTGKRRVAVSAPGYLPMTKVVELAGRDNLPINIQLQSTTVRVQGVGVNQVSSKKIPWIWWGATGVLAAGAITTGVVAMLKATAFDAENKKFGASQSQLSSLSSDVKTFGLVSDVFSVGTIALGAFAIYKTIKAPLVVERSERTEPPKPITPSTNVGVSALPGGGYIGVSSTF